MKGFSQSLEEEKTLYHLEELKQKPLAPVLGNIMSIKYAEMLGLRRAFPAELSGLHVQSEDVPHDFSKGDAQDQAIEIPTKLSQEQLEKLGSYCLNLKIELKKTR